jgi:hypothetical protein
MSAAFIDQSRTSKFARSKEPAPPANQANRRLLCSTFLGVTSPLHTRRESAALPTLGGAPR